MKEIVSGLAVQGRLALALITGVSIGALGGQWLGQQTGKKLERGEVAEQQVRDLGALIDSHTRLITEAADASTALRQSIARRHAADAKSTEEFKRALAADADLRADCVFSADVMRQLSEARARAIEAAASGVGGAVPGSTSTGQPTRR